MKAFAHWLRRNMLVPLLIVLAGSAVASIYRSMEIGALSYRQLQNAYKAGSSTFQSHVTAAMQNGVVSRWRYTALMQQYWVDASALAVELDVGEVASERQALADLVGSR
ncbi:hypothetical protein [Verminephrobacter eiseniae]|uniref:hypothetical protein n=2 Tax=Verminephrobacter eiseniae TaxID=364317 RepID=UPI0022383716|nr:hypothetical protein [Verminephrobacter eiseniae]MCW5292554.1 hypothetical protein [Verminephrobacter eiseniae]